VPSHDPADLSQCLAPEKAVELAGSNPDYGTQDLFEAIDSGDFPTWDVFIVRLSLIPLRALTSRSKP
jgi:catalase